MRPALILALTLLSGCSLSPTFEQIANDALIAVSDYYINKMLYGDGSSGDISVVETAGDIAGGVGGAEGQPTGTGQPTPTSSPPEQRPEPRQPQREDPKPNRVGGDTHDP